MVCVMKRVAPVGQQFNRLANSPGLVNAALLADGQVHGQVQKRIALSLRVGIHLTQGRIHIGEFCVVFGMLGNPLAG